MTPQGAVNALTFLDWKSVVALATIMGCSRSIPVEPVAWGDGFELGSYGIGFRSEQVVRDTPEGPRTLTLSLWYPADSESLSEPVNFGQLYDIVRAEEQLEEAFGLTIERGLAAAMTGDSMALSVEAAQALLSDRTFSRLNADAAAGRFPLILWSVRHATVVAQAPMAEVLASQGFVVATVWSSDPPLAFPWQDRPDSEKVATIESHTEDLSHVLSLLRSAQNVDRYRVILLAWSYGGESAALLQRSEGSIRGVVSIDANVVPAQPAAWLEIRRPLVWLVSRNTGARGFERLERLPTPWVSVRLPDLAHGNFNALEGLLPEINHADTVYSWSQGGDIAVQGYQSLVRMVTEVALSFRSDTVPEFDTLAARLEIAAEPLTVEINHSNMSR